MTRSSISIFNSFHSKILTLEKIRGKQESLFDKGYINRRDIEEVYAAIYVDAIAFFEALIEELFLGLLVQKIKPRISKFNIRVVVRSYSVARDILFQGKKYLNWLPYDNTEKRAELFFTGGRPFTVLSSTEKEHIERCLTIRHAIAHQSRHAIDKFKSEILSGWTLTMRDRNPKSFLRAQFSLSPRKTYYQHYIDDLTRLASTIC